MSCQRTVEINDLRICDCNECWMSQGCELCTQDECLVARARWREAGLAQTAAPCWWIGCPANATRTVIGGFPDAPKFYDFCAAHVAKVAQAA